MKSPRDYQLFVRANVSRQTLFILSKIIQDNPLYPRAIEPSICLFAEPSWRLVSFCYYTVYESHRVNFITQLDNKNFK